MNTVQPVCPYEVGTAGEPGNGSIEGSIDAVRTLRIFHTDMSCGFVALHLSVQSTRTNERPEQAEPTMGTLE